MAAPQPYDHDICSGEDYQFDITFKDAAGQPVNLTGFEVSCKIYDVLRNARAVAAVSIPDPAAGKVVFIFPERETRFLRGRLRCQAKAIGATGNIQYVIDGAVYVITAGDKPPPIEIAGNLAAVLPTIDGALIG